MDFKRLCDDIDGLACVISIEKVKDSYGEIRIVDGNDKYRETFSIPQVGSPLVVNGFRPNSLYTDYLEKNLSFEEYCFRSAIKKEVLHSYAYPEQLKAWFHMLFIPLSYSTKTHNYCMYIMEVHPDLNPAIASNVHGEIASKVLKTTVKLSVATDFRKALKSTLKDIREICNADLCCVLLIDDAKERLDLIAESKKDDSTLTDVKDLVSPEFYELAKTWKETLSNSNCLIISNDVGWNYLKDKNYAWYKSMKDAKVENLVLFPLNSRNKLIGYIWACNFHGLDTINIKETMEVTTFILGAEIGNYLLLNQLTEMSSVDILTGVCNRNEMNNYMNRLIDDNNDHTVGLLFLDINGLKKINDLKGHLAGDNLIKRAASALKNIFPPEIIFRAGGDEFIIILEKVTEEVVINYVSRIKDEASKRDVSLAIGYSIKNNTRDVLKALKEADENMYIDKRKHYGQKVV